MDEGERAERVVADYIAGMTDQYAITKFSSTFASGLAGGRLLRLCHA